MPNRARDWLNQAFRDLETAEREREAASHEWACFAAQQAADKAVKAIHLSLAQEAWGHDVAGLLQELPSDAAAPSDLIEKGRFLDNLYIPTRYPNSHARGAPWEHYGLLQSEQAIRYAREILEFARSQMGRR